MSQKKNGDQCPRNKMHPRLTMIYTHICMYTYIPVLTDRQTCTEKEGAVEVTTAESMHEIQKAL